MNEPSIFFNEVNERQGVFHRRAFFMGGFTTLGLLALGVRLADLQIVENDRYSMLAASNQYNFRLIPPPRGRILDRNGVEIASNRPNFRLLMLKDEAQNIDTVLDQVADLVPITPARRRQVKRQLDETQEFVPVAVVDDMSWDEFARVNVRAPELPGLQPDMGEARVYPFGGAFAHVVGYVSKVSDEDVKKAGDNPDPLLLNPGFRIGKTGVEKALDLDLRGKAGGQKVEVDAKGRVVREDPRGDIAPIPGKEVYLTLDADIQNRALEKFGDNSGAAVMMDCRTGDMLCLLSAPSFDANKFVKGVPAEEYRALAGYDHKPLFNKALTATYPPGSTFKTMVALAALEAGVDPHRTYVCNGAWAWGGRVWHCDKHHGVMNMHDAIKTSCDIFFYQTALSVGPDRIAAVARKFGLGEVHDIGLPPHEQRPGIVPDTAYKRRAFPHDPVWHPGETPSMGIGQGYVNVNALQLCVMCSRLANGTRALQPRLIHSIGGVTQPSGAAAPDLPFASQNIDFVRAAMAAVVNDGGTAALTAALGLGPVMMAGKTGTAQAHNYVGGHGEHGAQGAWALRDHAWFIGFAPYDDPRYALSVLV
ncbi:MAG: penicillin-binding protein 2, partial [Caulobacteraceae bacterium]|nr:penicillin-binding protein 2 [Caulobacteraceae bacterium]